MGVTHHIDRDTVHAHREVSAVVGVETAEQDLIRLAAPMLPANDEVRRHAQHVAWRIGRAQFQIFCPTGLLRHG